jgi:hypothetical protein
VRDIPVVSARSRGVPARAFGALLAAVFTVCAAATAQGPSSQPDFGPNVYILNPSMPATQIQSTLVSLSNEAQFSTNRYAILFMPGTYNVQAPVGYYEQIAGLGETPGGVTIEGFLTPNFGPAIYGSSTWPGVNITDTFWRSMENMTIDAATDTAQNAAPETLQWGVSQGAPLRRMQINGSLELTDSYCGNASGGFISDTVVTGSVTPCSQQQWYSRNSSFGSWNGGVWNMVFSGVEGAPAQSYPTPPETVLATTPVSREKPFLYVDAKGNFNVFSPAAQTSSSGTTWANGQTPGRSLPISRFFIAQPTTPVAEINLALLLGQNLILTPGIYPLKEPIRVLYPDTVVLGLGYATLVPQNGNAAITVGDVGGVQIAGLIIDAGPVNSPVLFQMGTNLFGGPLPLGGALPHAGNPSSISDVFFRIGGATAGSATTSLEVDSSDVILDDIWAWRADHGNGVGWTANTASHGVVVNGDRVTALGLAVEHYQQEQVLWNGNAGQTIFYQSELPYDPPSQSAWMDGAANGYPSYVVTASARTHQAWGLGIYSYFDQGINIVEDNAMTVPETSGMAIHDVGTVWLNGSGSITHVIDGTGAAVNSGFADQLSPVVAYP